MTQWTKLLALCALILSGCGWHPLVPQNVLTNKPPAHHARASVPLLGVDLYARKNYSLAAVRNLGARDLRYLSKSLGVQSIGIAWNLYTPHFNSNEVMATKSGSLSPAGVRILTELAQSYHLSVEYRPLLKVGTHARWGGKVEPTQRAAWFKSYYAAELPYLRVAEQMHVKEFVVSSELLHLGYSTLWDSFFAKAGDIYHGSLSYAAYQGSFFSSGRYALPVRSDLGVDTYPGVHLPATAPLPALVGAWSTYLSRAPRSVLQRTAVDEIGIPAETGAYRDPWSWTFHKGRKYDEKVQARWYTAACTAVARAHMRAIYFWNAALADNPYHPQFPDVPAFEGKAGANAIRGCLKVFQAEG